MQNYYVGLSISVILHLGLVLSFANFFQIESLYSLNKLEAMPAYLVFERPQNITKKNISKKINTTVNKEPAITSPLIQAANTKTEMETIDLEKSLLMKQIKKRESFSSVEEISIFSNLIRQQVMINWKQPPSAIRGMTSELTIKLVPTGEIVGVRIAKSSGNKAFDNSALDAVEKVIKFEGLNMSRKLFDSHFRNFTLVFSPKN